MHLTMPMNDRHLNGEQDYVTFGFLKKNHTTKKMVCTTLVRPERRRAQTIQWPVRLSYTEKRRRGMRRSWRRCLVRRSYNHHHS